ncbi:MAG TPA: peptidylprolyl isomerase [Chitinophagaceae bacterium]|nr:peptidylprolyl isomerase [Chitinophagaceae bacterium]
MVKKLLYILILLCLLLSCSHPKYKYPHILIETRFGDIEVELYPDKAPKSVAAFLSYVDSGYYTNSSFYRVLKEENQPSGSFKSQLIQGGIWQTDYKKGSSLPGIPHEPTNQSGILHTNGTISLARTTPGTASSEFFICIEDQPAYDYGGLANADKQGFAAFGRVIKGMDIVRKIHQQPDYEESFDPPIEIFNIRRL